MQADYTAQLQAIARALNKTTPWWQHPWLLATFSTTLGVIGGFVGQLLLQRYTAYTKLQSMRKMTYVDICELLSVIDTILQDKARFEQLRTEAGVDAVKAMLPPICEDYVKANPEIYARLPERLPRESVINLYHLISDNPTPPLLLSLCQIISLQFERGRLDMKLVRKHMGRESADMVVATLPRYRVDGLLP